jgi:hypothetical protein
MLARWFKTHPIDRAFCGGTNQYRLFLRGVGRLTVASGFYTDVEFGARDLHVQLAMCKKLSVQFECGKYSKNI